MTSKLKRCKKFKLWYPWFIRSTPDNTLLSSGGKLTTDDLNSLIAHAHRRIDQLNKLLADQRVREQKNIEAALERQKLEDKNVVESAVAKALEHHRHVIENNQEKKVTGAFEFLNVLFIDLF